MWQQIKEDYLMMKGRLKMKERLDVLLVKRNLAESREKAKAIIMSGNVFVEGSERGQGRNHFPGRCKD